MADDNRIELPTRDTTPTLHEEPENVSRPKDNGRIDLTTPKPVAPELTASPETEQKPEEAPKEESTNVEAPKDDDIEMLRKKRKELEEDNFKYRDRLRRERENSEELKARLERLESSVSSVSSDKEFDAQVRETQAELGVDEESAKKLVRTVRKISQPKQENQPLNPVQKAAKEFASQASEAMDEFSDWDSHRQKMTELLEADIKANGELKALKRGPLYYYAESRRLTQGDPESAKAQGRKEMAEKVNQKNLSVSESSRNSHGRPTPQVKWTRESIQELARNNPDEYMKRRPEIMAAMSRGEIQ
jgi:hypothetical protein